MLLSYPNFDKPFDIHTNASDLQLGVVISQNKKPIAFYSRKLNFANTLHDDGKRNDCHCGNTQGIQKYSPLAKKLSLHRP